MLVVFGGLNFTFSKYMAPVDPSIVISSPSDITLPSSKTSIFSCSLKATFLAPTMHGIPIALATTAAWLVIPPFTVNTPRDSDIAFMSSDIVSVFINIASVSVELYSITLLVDIATFPEAAPGLAGTPKSATLGFISSGTEG